MPVLVRDGRPCLTGSQNFNTSYTVGAPNPYSYGYQAYSSNSVYTNTYSCAYSSLPALPPTSTAANAFMNMNLGNPQSQVPQVSPCQGTLQGIRAW